MMQFRPTLLVTALCASVATGVVYAEDRPAANMRDKASNAISDMRDSSGADKNWEKTHRATKIIGSDVRNPQGEDLGDIKELVVDPANGDISYAVVSFGGVMGVGGKLFAVPWKALKLDTAGHDFVLNIDKERLKNAPGFESSRWPDMANQQWNSEVHRYYGQRYEGGSGRVGAAPR